MLLIILGKRGCIGMGERKVQELALQLWKITPAQKNTLNCLGLRNDTLLLLALRDHCMLNSDKTSVHGGPFGIYTVETKPEVNPAFSLLIKDSAAYSVLLKIETPSPLNCP